MPMSNGLEPAWPQERPPYERCRSWQATIRAALGHSNYILTITLEADHLHELVEGVKEAARELAALGAR